MSQQRIELNIFVRVEITLYMFENHKRQIVTWNEYNQSEDSTKLGNNAYCKFIDEFAGLSHEDVTGYKPDVHFFLFIYFFSFFGGGGGLAQDETP